ncbi:hypothetical protein RFI_06121 [Reticulomyxa filosa]|uniref:Uncharacterized protein n=1 Tax=Reticulomyxa filosa TaxID=46433 RepID=X6P0E7_RETFI|nr:hypothetical protein RFI_06121 [Reticulomyxa filosa]|eukprot:ETO30997.1 hypothetical protein RFI_06121 [Reticulomyxa filosa]
MDYILTITLSLWHSIVMLKQFVRWYCYIWKSGSDYRLCLHIGKQQQTVLFNSFESIYNNSLSENDLMNYLNTACSLFGSEKTYQLIESISTTNVNMTKLSELSNQILTKNIIFESHSINTQMDTQINNKEMNIANSQLVYRNLFVMLNICKKTSANNNAEISGFALQKYFSIYRGQC